MTFRADQFFEAAIAAGRAALRDLEPDQIPPSLRRVAAYSGGTLPPPFAKSMLIELVRNEFLRGKAAEHLDRSPGTSRVEVAAGLLEQGDGWLLEVIERAFADGQRAGSRGDATVELERDALEAEVIGLRERLRAIRVEAERVEREARSTVEAARRPARADRMIEEGLRAELEQARRELADRASEAEDRHNRLVVELAEARALAREARRERAEMAKSIPAGGPGLPSLASGDLARHLDLLVAAVATDAAASGDDAEREVSAPLQFPLDVRPDSADAIDWLRRCRDIDVVLDGYNVGFLLAGELDPVRARSLTEEVGRRLTAGADMRLTIVFDSEIDEQAPPQGSGSMRVVFSGGRIGDDVVVERAGDSQRSVVVSNDREVRQRSEANGAVSLWSDALAEWSRRR